MWTPINKKTKHRYPPITDAEKANWLEDKHIKERYVFEWVKPSELDEPKATVSKIPDNGIENLAFEAAQEMRVKAEAKVDDTQLKENIPEPIEAKKKAPKAK